MAPGTGSGATCGTGGAGGIVGGATGGSGGGSARALMSDKLLTRTGVSSSSDTFKYIFAS